MPVISEWPYIICICTATHIILSIVIMYYQDEVIEISVLDFFTPNPKSAPLSMELPYSVISMSIFEPVFH